ncbi:SIMPL domain-containing protein [Rossellomorea marisflavi]|uniref:SIMPL domain-containing protein n=1 Tax=Rossellomorea marisflavi TaxID=189381 RepID=UPI00404414CA
MFPYMRVTDSRGTITVSGEHTSYGAPDEALLTLGVMTEGPDLQKAQQENNENIKNIVGTLQANGVSKSDIQTANYQIIPRYSFEDGKQIFNGYEVVNILRIHLRSIERAGKIIDDAVKAGANRVEGIQFLSSHSTALYQHALEQAYRDALAKATVLARQSGQELVPDPLSIKEGQSVEFPSPMKLAVQESAILPGEISVKASLIVTFTTH